MPTLTEIVGVPTLPPGASNLRLTVTIDPPYQGGPNIGLSPSEVSAVRNGDDTRWVYASDTTAPLKLPLARRDITCPAPDGWLRAILTYSLAGHEYRTEPRDFRPQANTAGVLDLREDQSPAGIISPQGVLDAVDTLLDLVQRADDDHDQVTQVLAESARQQQLNNQAQLINNETTSRSSAQVGRTAALLDGWVESTDRYPLSITDEDGRASLTQTPDGRFRVHTGLDTPDNYETADNALGAVNIWTDEDGRIGRYETADGTLHDLIGGPALPATAAAPLVYLSGGNLYRSEGLTPIRLTGTGDVGQLLERTAGRLLYTRAGQSYAARTDANGVSLSIDAVPGQINHIQGYGQSLSVGTFSTPVQTTTPQGTALMFNDGVRSLPASETSFVPLVEDAGPDPAFDANDVGETPMSGTAAQLQRRVLALDPAADYRLLASTAGHGGYVIADLSQGTPYYTRLLDQVRNAKRIAEAQGLSYAYRALHYVQGESDSGAGTADYYTPLRALHRALSTDIRAITGQAHDIPLFLCQIDVGSDFVVALGQLRYTEENDNAFLVGPKYQLTRHTEAAGSIVHLDGPGSRHLGELHGKVAARVLLDHLPWRPLSPRRVWVSGGLVYVQFFVPVAPIIFDATSITRPEFQPMKAQDGFELRDAQGDIPLITRIVSADTVQLTPGRAIGSGADVRYGMQLGPRGGNLRDSDTAPSLFGNALWNWCVHFRKPLNWRAY
jgi:hypothetical protein